MIDRVNHDPLSAIYALVKEGKYSAALELLWDPERKRINAPYKEDLNCAWYSLGDIYFRLERFPEAKSAFKHALDRRSDDADAMMAIGNCYDALHRPTLAERYFRKALAAETFPLSPMDRAEIRYNLANALFDQRRYDEARELYRSVSASRGSLGKMARKNLSIC